MGKATGTNAFTTAGECAFCDQTLRSKSGAQYHVQVQHGQEITRRIEEDAATRSAGGTIHPYLRAKETAR
jgi:hypothetical protein